MCPVRGREGKVRAHRMLHVQVPAAEEPAPDGKVEGGQQENHLQRCPARPPGSARWLRAEHAWLRGAAASECGDNRRLERFSGLGICISGQRTALSASAPPQHTRPTPCIHRPEGRRDPHAPRGVTRTSTWSGSGYDTLFLERAPALVSGTLKGAYLILAGRALGLDCGPMGGLRRGQGRRVLLPGTSWRSSFLVNLGHRDPTKLQPRNPRLELADACRIE